MAQQAADTQIRGTIHSIQMLRAVAAASVVYFHISNPVKFGSFGVDVFFVLSGFVIAMVIGTTRPSAATFMRDRLTRIIPLYWILSCLVFAAAFVAPYLFNSTTADLGNLVKSLLFVPYYKENGLLYPILFVGWSLNYEIAFYLAMALSLVLARAHPFLVGGTIVLVLFGAARAIGPVTAMTEFLSNERVVEFAMGLAVWHVTRKRFTVPGPLAAAGCAASYGLMAFFEAARVDAPWLILYGLPSVVLLICTVQLDRYVRNGRVVRVLTHLGNASYATYLSHPYVVELARKVAPRLSDTFTINTVAGTVITLAAALSVGSILYVVLDKPAVRLARRLVGS